MRIQAENTEFYSYLACLPYPFDDHDRLLTENDDAAADTYDSDADCCRLRRRRALSTGGHSAS